MQHDAATPLQHAAEEGDDLLIRALINIGANVNEADSEGQTPLMAAASWGTASSVRILVKEAKANLEAKDMVKETSEGRDLAKVQV